MLVWIKNGQLTSFLYIGDHERDKTNERNWESLPDGDFWSTVAASRILITGTATSNRHPRKGGTAYCRANEFDALAIEYIVDRGLKLDGLPKRFRFRNLTRNRPTPGELDDWMVENVRHWVKRDLTIIARNNYYSDNFQTLDLHLSKDLRLGERFKVTGVVELFNAYNYQQYKYNTLETAATFGQRNGTVSSPRTGQLGIKFWS